jgi:hypothetical protein
VAILCQSTQRTLYALTNRRVQAPQIAPQLFA